MNARDWRVHSGAIRALLLAPLAACVLHPSIASARTWHVLPDGTGNAPTIQAAIDSAVAGDVVLVAPGEYSDTLVLKPGLTLTGEGGAAATIIHGWLDRSVLTLTGVTDALVTGLTFTGGTGTEVGPDRLGGAILCMGSTLTLRDCVISDSHVPNPNWYDDIYGGGMASIGGSSVVIENCTFEGNSLDGEGDGRGGRGAGLYTDVTSSLAARGSRFASNHARYAAGGGIGSDNPGAVFEDCIIEENAAYGGGGFYGHGAITRCVVRANRNWAPITGTAGVVIRGGRVEDCLIVANQSGSAVGGGLMVVPQGEVAVRRCTITGNGGNEGAGLWVEGGPGASPCTIENNIIALNNAEPSNPGYGVYMHGMCPPEFTFRCNDVWGHTGADYTGCAAPTGSWGNFSADPLFCDTQHDVYTLDAASPCLPGHDPYGEDCGLVGAFDRGCGVSASQARSWGSVKSLFR